MTLARNIAVILALTAVLVGCGDDDRLADLDGGTSRGVQDVDDGYRVILRGAVVDTLTGRAQFGHVLDPSTGQLNWIIELVTADDFAGGMFIASPLADAPQASRLGITIDAMQEADGESLALLYRQGVFRVFRGRSGSVNFSHLSDTLVTGTFDAILTGEVAERGREAVRGEAEVIGTFSARRGAPGYVIGL